jgi:hypothetical protein
VGRQIRLPARSLDLDLGASLDELGLGLLGIFLGGLLEHLLRGAVDEVLRFFEAQARDLSHDLDDLNLRGTGAGEDDVELVLLLLDFCRIGLGVPLNIPGSFFCVSEVGKQCVFKSGGGR